MGQRQEKIKKKQINMGKERIKLKNKTLCGYMLGHVWCVRMLVWLHKCEPGIGGMCVSKEYSDTPLS